MAQTEVLVQIESDGSELEKGLSQINSDVSPKEVRRRETGTGSVLPQDTETGDRGNSQPPTDTTFQCHQVAVGEVKQRENLSKITILQMVILVSTVAALLCSLLVSKLKSVQGWGLSLWKWAVMAFVLFSGRLVSCWIVWVVVHFMKRNSFMIKGGLYFIYVLREPVGSCLWLLSVLIVWVVLLNWKLEKETNSPVLPYITRILVCPVVSNFIWLLKTLLTKVLVMSFHIKYFDEELRKAQVNQYVITKLSLPPLRERQGRCMQGLNKCFKLGVSDWLLRKHGDAELEYQNMSMSSLLNKDKVNVPLIMKSMNQSFRNKDFLKFNQDTTVESQEEKKIETENEARNAAKSVFNHVTKNSLPYISLENVRNYMTKEDAEMAMESFQQGNANKRIDLSSFSDWMVAALRQRKALSLSLSQAQKVVNDLRTKLNIFTIAVIIVFWVLILGNFSRDVLLYLASQIIMLGFIFGNTCKTIFEGFVFIFVIHPFNIGDRCEVDGVEMVVKKMKILTTVFVRKDNLKVLFPNSVLATKPIINYHRSKNVRKAPINQTTNSKDAEEKGEQEGERSVDMAQDVEPSEDDSVFGAQNEQQEVGGEAGEASHSGCAIEDHPQ